DRALFLQRWQRLLLETLTTANTRSDPARQAMRREAALWGGRATIDSIGFRIVRRFRQLVREEILNGLTIPCKPADSNFSIASLDPNVETSVWRLLQERPAHLVPPGYSTWDGLLLECIDRLSREIQGKHPSFEQGLRAYTWGAHNTPRIQHPLSQGV